MFKRYRFFGFTLLELLVVISIIGILLAVGAVAFSNAQKKGRDSRRRSDMKSLQNAFEQYYAQNGSYADCDTMADENISGGHQATKDPKTGVLYTDANCSVATDHSSYCVCAELETGGGNSSDGSCNWTTDPNSNYFCVQNLQ